MRFVATAFAYLFALGVIAVVTFFAVIILAGPHSGLLPAWIEAAVLIAGWATVIVVPVVVAHRVWRRFEPSKKDTA